jgi:hypothetical protein
MAAAAEAPAGVPASPKAGRQAHFRANLRGRFAFWTLFIGIGASVLAGAAKHSVQIAAIGALATVAAVVFFAYRSASQRAQLEFFIALAPTLGMQYVGEIGMFPVTPLLGAGQRRRFEHAMQGGGGTLSLYTYEVEHRAPNGESARWDPYHFTVCVVDLAPSMPDFPGVYVRRKQGLIHGDDWLRTHRSRRVELESIAFNERYDLLLAQGQDELVVRELFSPSLIDWLAAHPLQPGFELRAGVLCVWLPGHVEEAGKLAFFVDAAQHLADAVQREATEAASTSYGS